MDALAESPRQGRDWLLPILLLTLVAGLFPFAADYVLFHPDERHYVDAGMGMLRSGDFLTPRHANGDLRLKKPLLPYWVAAAGFWAVGVSPLGGRIGFLLAGIVVVWLTWKTARLSRPLAPRVARAHHTSCERVSRSETPTQTTHLAATLAATIAACHPALLISAPRSVPDVCLALGVAISQWGFVGILAHGTMRRRWLVAAFGGGAVAVLSKGLPGAAFVGFATAFLIWRMPSLALHHWRALIGAALTSAALSGSWFAFIAARHQNELARQFVNDQIGSQRFVDNGWEAAAHFPAYALIIAATLAPWLSSALYWRRKHETTEYTDHTESDQAALSNGTRFSRSMNGQWTSQIALVPVLGQSRRSLLPSFRSFRVFRGSSLVNQVFRQPHVQLLLGWTLLYCGLASFVNHVSPRYLLPVIPALAIVVADVLTRCDAESIRRGLRRLLSVSAMAAIAAAVIALLLVRSMSALSASVHHALMLCTILGIAILLLWRSSARWGRAGQAAAVAVCVHATLLVAGITLHATLPDSFAEQVDARLNASGMQQGRVIVVGAPAHATRLRVELDGRFDVVWAGDTALPPDAQPSDIIVFDERIADPAHLADDRTHLVTCGYREYEASELCAALISGRLRDFLLDRQKHYVVAMPGTMHTTDHDIQQVGWEHQ